MSQPGAEREQPILVTIVGAGGHGRVLLDVLRRMGGPYRVGGFVDAAPDLQGTELDGVRVLGDDSYLEDLEAAGELHLALGVGTVRPDGPRARIFESLARRGFVWVTAVDPSAQLSERATLGAGTTLMPGAIVNAGAVLGDDVIINTGAIVEHDCRLGDHVHVATGARLAGSVVVERGAHVGAGAIVREGVRIGAAALVGAGAVVVKDVPAGAVVVGVPARPLGAA